MSETNEQPDPGYLSQEQIEAGVSSLKTYILKSKAIKLSNTQRKNLLEAGEDNAISFAKVFVEVVFKNIPSNSKTYIHNVLLPNHWRVEKLKPEDYNIAVFVKHCKPKTEAEKIQFSKDRDLDIDNTHSHYQKLFEEKLDDNIRSRISRIITTKELATEFNTFQKLDRLSKTYDLFLSDKPLMANKMNSLPRRLGRRFWVREKKVPLMLNLQAKNLQDQFTRVLAIEPFYVMGVSSTESIQIGMINQSDEDLVENMKAFLDKLYNLYGDNVRFIKLRTEWGLSLPLFADLSSLSPKITMKAKKIRQKPVIDDFDMLDDDAKIVVHADGTVKVLRQKRKTPDEDDADPVDSFKKNGTSKKTKKIKQS